MGGDMKMAQLRVQRVWLDRFYAEKRRGPTFDEALAIVPPVHLKLTGDATLRSVGRQVSECVCVYVCVYG